MIACATLGRAANADLEDSLPPVDGRLFPANRPRAIAWFWVSYWLGFFALLPWMLLRQLAVSLGWTLGALWTWNRDVELLAGALTLRFMSHPCGFPATALFGERFVAIQYSGVLIDPGPVFARPRIERAIERDGRRARIIAVTHAHEEHLGNAAALARRFGLPITATVTTLAAVRAPEIISGPRRILMGQPEAADDVVMTPLGATLCAAGTELEVIASPGHCAGHASFYDRTHKILFAGDSYLHAVFTAPNHEVSADEWIATLERYRQLDVRTLIGTHGYVESIDPAVPARRFVTARRDPRRLIADKLAFLKWARRVVAEGERRGLPYGVIEACLFPWRRWWAWRNWFGDESWRLFSAGEFSRTHFVRSLAAHPDRVPARFPLAARLAARCCR